MKSALVVTILALSLVVPASAPAAQIDPADQAELQAAREVWASKEILDYSYKVRRFCFCSQDYTRPRNIVVESGKPVKRRQTKAYRDVDTVENLFKKAQATLDDDSSSVRYDATYGYPRVINSDPSFMIADEEVSFTVRKFRVPKD